MLQTRGQICHTFVNDKVRSPCERDNMDAIQTKGKSFTFRHPVAAKDA